MELEALAYYAAKRILSQKIRDRLKLVQYDVKAKLAPLKKVYHGTFNAEDLYNELVNKIPNDFEILMVHSSHAGLLPMYQGSMRQIMDTLIRLCGNDRTLAMPAFFFGEGEHRLNAIEYFGDHPNFDIYDTPSQMGLITELFRNHPGTVVSHHPTHRIVALGPHAQELVSGHEVCKFSCGAGSPFHKMASLQTVIIGVGVKYFRSLTQLHSPEQILLEQGQHPGQYELRQVDVTMVDKSENHIPYQLTVPRLIGKYMPPSVKSDVTQWSFHGAPLYYCRAGEVQQRILAGHL